MWGYPIPLVTEHKVDYLIKKGRLEAEHDNKVAGQWSCQWSGESYGSHTRVEQVHDVS